MDFPPVPLWFVKSPPLDKHKQCKEKQTREKDTFFFHWITNAKLIRGLKFALWNNFSSRVWLVVQDDCGSAVQTGRAGLFHSHAWSSKGFCNINTKQLATFAQDSPFQSTFQLVCNLKKCKYTVYELGQNMHAVEVGKKCIKMVAHAVIVWNVIFNVTLGICKWVSIIHAYEACVSVERVLM